MRENNMTTNNMRLQAKAANVKSAMDMAANIILEEVKNGTLKGFSANQIVERFDMYTDTFFNTISNRQEKLLDEVETVARS